MYSVYKHSYCKLFPFTNLTDKEFHELMFSNETSKELNTDTKTITNNQMKIVATIVHQKIFVK